MKIGNSIAEQSHDETLNSTVDRVMLGAMNCQSNGGRFDLVLDYIRDYQSNESLDIFM